jgi:hypothetical protein
MLVLDKDSKLLHNYDLILSMNVVVKLDYDNHTFDVMKNRWAGAPKNVPMAFLGEFLGKPDSFFPWAPENDRI